MAGEPILVVDDDPAHLRLVLLLLSSDAYDTRTAGDAAEARAILQSFSPKVILLELHLPGMDGLQLARRLKADARTRDVPLVALTAAVTGDEEARAILAGFDRVLTKPVDGVLLRSL